MLLILPNLFIKKINEFHFIEKLDIKNTKKKLKDLAFKEFRKELLHLKAKKQEIDNIFFRNKLQLGLFRINTENIKQILIKNIKIAEDTFFEVLLGKVAKQNQRVTEDV